MKRTKVLFVVNNFNIGGVQKSLLSLLYKINLDLYDVSLIILSGEGSLTKYLPEKVAVIPPDPIINYSVLAPKNFFQKSVRMFFSPNRRLTLQAGIAVALGVFRRNMTREKQRYWLKAKERFPKLDLDFDVAIGVSGGHSMMYIADCVEAKKKIGWIRSDYRVLNRDHEIDRMYFQEMNEIISVSHFCKDIFLDIFPETSSKVKVMYNVLPFCMYENIPSDTSVMNKEKGVCSLLSICRLDPHKGLDLAIEALEILLKKEINIKWFILGEGIYKKELVKQVKKRGLQKHVILLGFQLNTAEFIKKADIIVHPSRFEGKSNVIDEAKYLLKPIVSTRYETVHEQLVHEQTGLISEMNPQSLAMCIERVIHDEYLVKKFRQNLLGEQYDDTNSINVFQEVLES